MGYAQDIYDMDRGWTEAKNELASDTVINCMNPSPTDNLNSVRVAAQILREITHIENHVMREQAEELIEEVSNNLAEMQKQPADNSQAVGDGFAFIRRIREMVEAFNAVKVCAHCEICRSSFVGMGPTSEAAMVEANESLASHSAKYHPVQS